jgi:GNAT superfamily N-acetyltransferase
MIKIEKAIPEDALGIAIVNVYTWRTAYSGLIPDKIIDSRIDRVIEIANRNRIDIEESNTFIVAKEDNTIIGFAWYGESRNEEFVDSGEIYALYVLSGFQEKGIGRDIFTLCIEELKKLGCSSVIINCLEGNNSMEFYKHMGGKVVSKRKDKIQGVYLSSDILLFEI